jgi:hypothetical protein
MALKFKPTLYPTPADCKKASADPGAGNRHQIFVIRDRSTRVVLGAFRSYYFEEAFRAGESLHNLVCEPWDEGTPERIVEKTVTVTVEAPASVKSLAQLLRQQHPTVESFTDATAKLPASPLRDVCYSILADEAKANGATNGAPDHKAAEAPVS